MDFEDSVLHDRDWMLAQPIGTIGVYVDGKIDSGVDDLSLAPGEGLNGSTALLVECTNSTQGLPGFHILNALTAYGYIDTPTNDAGYLLPRGMRANRMEFWLRFQQGFRITNAASSINQNLHFGTYHYDPSIPGIRKECNNWHFYHQIMLRHDQAGTNWIHVVLNEDPQHQRSLNTYISDNPVLSAGNHWELLTRCYIDCHPYHSDPEISYPIKMWVDDITLSYVPEPNDIEVQFENYLPGQELVFTNDVDRYFQLLVRNVRNDSISGVLVTTTPYWLNPSILDPVSYTAADTNLTVSPLSTSNFLFHIRPNTNLLAGRLDPAGVAFIPTNQFALRATYGYQSFSDTNVEKRWAKDLGPHDGIMYGTHMRVRIGSPTGNDKPTSVGGKLYHSLEDKPLTQTLTAIDPDNDSLTYSLLSQDDTNITLNPGTGTFDFRPENGYTGYYTFVYRVEDNVSGSNDAACWIQVDADTDHDNLPDAWEMSCFSNLTYSANDDPDHDDYCNEDEYVTGTSPTDSNSFLTASIILTNKIIEVSCITTGAIGSGYTGRTRYASIYRTYDLSDSTWTLVQGCSSMVARGVSSMYRPPMTKTNEHFSIQMWMD